MSTAERRTVAVLFSDLSGFTALSESMDPEDVRDLVDALFARFRRVIEARGGTIDKFIGDAVMAVFGAPVAHEDDPVRAVRAALAMQDEIEAFNRERKHSLGLRVGVNLGEVLWGGVGGDRATAMGDAVNVAQRLESAARPGTVLVSDSVRAAAAGRIRFRDAGEFALKGRKETVRAYEAAPGDPGAESAIIEGVGGALHGRQDELARLEAAWNAGSPRVLVVQGEAGIGKSRLLADLRRRVRASGAGAAVFSGRALQETPLPLSPFAELARQSAGTPANVPGWFAGVLGEGAVAARQADLIALSLGFPIPDERRAMIDGAAARDETLPAWRAWFRALATSRRVLLCLEDLHWADAATCELAEALASAAPEGRALVVASSRPCNRPLPGDLIPLGELPAAAVRAVAQGVFGEPLSDALADFLVRQSGGNPYYAEELARHLRRQRLVSGRPLDLAASPDRVPASLLGVLVARIDAQSPACRETLKAASVLGRVFWPALLPAGSEAALEEARDASLVVPSPASVLPGEPALQFRHALLRDAAYGLLTKRDRAALHKAAAEALEPRAVTAGRGALTLAAGHREAAGDASGAARLHRQVAKDAAVSNPTEARAAGLEAVRLEDGAHSRELLGHACFVLGRIAEARPHADAALALCGADPMLRARAAMLSANLDLHTADFARALQVASSRIDPALGPELDLKRRGLRCRALGGLGRTEEALQETEVGPGNPGEPRDVQIARAFVLGERGAVLLRLSRFEEALAAHRAALEAHRHLDNPLGISGSINNIATLLFRLKRTEEALSHLEQSLSSARALGTRHGIAITLTNVGACLNRLNRWKEAETALREALAIRTETGAVVGYGSIYLNLGRSLAMQGRIAECLDVLSQGCERTESLADPLPWLRLMVRRAWLVLDVGSGGAPELLEGVRRRLHERPEFAAEPTGQSIAATLLFLDARIAAGEGKNGEALRLLAEAIPRYDGVDEKDDAAAARLLAARLGSPEGPADALRALEDAGTIPHRALQAEALAVLARFEAKAGKRDEALARLAESAKVSEAVVEELEQVRILGVRAEALDALGATAEAEAARGQSDVIGRRIGACSPAPF